MASIAQEYSLFEIDSELDALLDEIEEEIECRGEASAELVERFQQFCEAHGEKADRIGRFLRMMEARVQYCRSEATRLQERARSSDRKVTQTKYMVMYYLKSRDLRKIEGREFTLRIQKNSQDSVRFTDETQVPMRYRNVSARIEGPLWEKLIECVPDELKRTLSLRFRMQRLTTRQSSRRFRTRLPFPAPRSTAATTCELPESPFRNRQLNICPLEGYEEAVCFCASRCSTSSSRVELRTSIRSFKLPPGAIFRIRTRSQGMAQAIDRVLVAIREKQRITIHGDYDCDGVLGTLHLAECSLQSGRSATSPPPPQGRRVRAQFACCP